MTDVPGGVNAAPSRLHDNNQLVHRFGRRPSQVLDAGFHIHHHDFIPGQNNMHDQGPQQSAFRANTAGPALLDTP